MIGRNKSSTCIMQKDTQNPKCIQYLCIVHQQNLCAKYISKDVMRCSWDL